jgi:hypothetical protein
MRILLQGGLGSDSLQVLFRILETPQIDACRGAVFFLAMASWGADRIDPLPISFADTLANLAAVAPRAPAPVLLEMLLGLRRLVTKFGTELIDDIIDILIGAKTTVLADAALGVATADLIASLLTNAATPALLEAASAYTALLIGNDSALNAIIAHQQGKIHPSDPEWLDGVAHLMRSFFADDRLPDAFRRNAFEFVTALLERYAALFADDLVRAGIIPFGTSLASCSETFQMSAYEALCGIAGALQTDAFPDLLGLIRTATESRYCGVREKSVDWLAIILKRKLVDPCHEHCLLVYETLVGLVAHPTASLRHDAVRTLARLGAARSGAASYDDGAIVSVYVFASSKSYDVRTSAVLPIASFWSTLLDALDAECDKDAFTAALQAVAHFCSGNAAFAIFLFLLIIFPFIAAEIVDLTDSEQIRLSPRKSTLIVFARS